jgi:purine-nucleoside/S-methyl-5'-thioadenosine phosphorylase / adenosine deaminase
MLIRRQSREGPIYYVSPLLEGIGVPHAFSTRVGGLSPAPFDSLNLGNPNGFAVQDDYERIYENYRLLENAIGCRDQTRLWVHQVHGATVASAMRGKVFESGAKADAIVSDDPGKLLAVRVADCVPVLISTEDGKIVAAIHAGWRGVIAGVVTCALRQLCNRGHRAESLIAAIGPCIGFDAFEVGPEVVDEFERVFGNEAPSKRTDDGKGRVDLRRAVQMQLMNGDVPEHRIDQTDRCTYRDRDEFFSHRRDKGITGRMAALICPRE